MVKTLLQSDNRPVISTPVLKRDSITNHRSTSVAWIDVWKAFKTQSAITSLKGKRSFGKKKIFFSSPRQGNIERKSKLKKKLKFPYFRPHKRLFGSAESELNGGERSVF